MNILILSVGTRNKIVQYFKNALRGNGKIIAADCSKLAPALYEADSFYIVPRITEEDYLDTILDICKKENINGVLSLIDPELSILASNKEKFKKIGTTVIGSSLQLCERAFDKMQMYHWLKSHGYACARSYGRINDFYRDLDAGLISFPVIIKPIRGSASIAISKVNDRETLEMYFNKTEGFMIQEFLNGQEIGADVYIDLISREVVSIFTKKKILMRAGETDKSVSFKNPKLFDFIEKFVTESGWLGQIDIDIFDVDGVYHISEVNPRFGGGYPHAYECGCDHMKLILNNLAGKINKKQIGDYEEDVYMMKYNEIAIKKGI
ncbi:MAG TPA: ATP-grasp domain-containing protein [Clostridiales bacterium]|nr:ATP-grasp domain-containing protein [Clostridiales bacterium]